MERYYYCKFIISLNRFLFGCIMRKLFFALLMLLSSLATAHDIAAYRALDSLLKVKNTATDDSSKMAAYRKIAMLNLDVDTLLHYTYEYLDSARCLADDYQVAVALYAIGRQYTLKSDFKNALKWTLKCQQFSDSAKVARYMGYSRTQLAAIFSQVSDLNSMLRVANEALSIAEENRDSATLPWAYYMIGALYNQIYIFDNADKYYKKALNISLKTNDRYSIANLCQAIASNLVLQVQHTKSGIDKAGLLRMAKTILFENFETSNVHVMIELNSLATASEIFTELYFETGDRLMLDSAEHYCNIGREKYLKTNVKMYENAFNALSITHLTIRKEYGKARKIIEPYIKEGNAEVLTSIDGIQVLEAIIFFYKQTHDYRHFVDMQMLLIKARYKNFSLEFGVSQVTQDTRHTYTQILRERESELLKQRIKDESEQHKAESIKKFTLAILIIACCFIIYYIVKYAIHSQYSRNLKSQSNQLMEQNAELEALQREISSHNREIEQQKAAISEQSALLLKASRKLRTSLEFARKIQIAVMHNEDCLKDIFSDSFLYFRPREIVSGDFYWARQIGSRKYVAAGDCTGHGVPGGLLSIIGISSLNVITGSSPNLSPAEILDRLRMKFYNTINDADNPQNVDDGMDIALVCLDGDKLTFASAGRPLIHVRNGEISVFRGDHKTIGNGVGESSGPFRNQEINLLPGDIFYIFSDGITDQFGGKITKSKFTIKRLQQLILKVCDKPMDSQLATIESAISKWMEKPHNQRYPQIDDQLLIGIKCE